MALQSSGPISLDDIHVEVGGTTGTTVSINDTDVRNLISSTPGTQVSFNDYYGATSSIWSVQVLTATSTYRGILNTSSPSSLPITYQLSGTITDDTFDPVADQGIASTATLSTPAAIRDFFSQPTGSSTFLSIWSVSSLSNAGFSSLTSSGTGGDTHSETINRTDASFVFLTSYSRWTWNSTNTFFPAFATTYDITTQQELKWQLLGTYWEWTYLTRQMATLMQLLTSFGIALILTQTVTMGFLLATNS